MEYKYNTDLSQAHYGEYEVNTKKLFDRSIYKTYKQIEDTMPMRRKFRARRKGAKRGKGLVSKIKRVVSNMSETKYYDTGSSGQTITYTVSGAQVIELSDLGQGSTDLLRVGDQVYGKSLVFRYHVVPNATAPTTQLLRLIFFQWHPDTTVLNPDSAVDNIVQTNTSGTPYVTEAPLNYDQSKGSNFRLLKDVRFALDTNHPKVGTVRLSKFKRNMQYKAANTTGMDQLFVLALSNIQTNGPTLTWYARFTFKDM